MAALSMVENEKRKSVGYLPTHRDSLASPPPPPYRSSDHGGVVVPLSASAATTPSPLHFSVGAPVGAIPGHAASSARELKRHSLPAFRTNAAAAAGLQWPSAMTHSIARPKLARTMPPQAIPIFGTTSSAQTMAQYQSQSQAAAAAAAKAGDTFPSFWEDAKQRRTHWIFYSVSTIALASLLCVFMMPIVAIWVAALPGAMTLIMAGQYSVYRWRRRQFYRRRGLANRSSSTSKTKTSTKPTQVPPVSTSTSSQPMNHSASSSLFSLSFAGSAKSRTGSDDGNGGQDTDSNGHSRVSSTSFLEPHQPPPDAQSSQFQHRYYGPASPDRMRSTGQIDEENGSEHPTPRFMGALQRHGSMSSLASSETVSSTSTSTTTSEDPCHLDLEPFSSSHTMVQAQQLLSSRTSPTNSSSHGIAMPPPPAYVSKKCDQMVVVTSILHHNGNGSGILGTNTISTALPEIAPMGDLMSELSLDFGSFDY
ncbi:hypothetical protein BGW38_003875 [Lunasporangiospora selenospora]|uniref:Uncharacterized protein n=1 Tax=Lunasporangiospora selenospora TaxID=979761 RepID=A0A9P6KCJ7_9FUNG|nr:hypothetical protein BGW38_003875 [Lunasporangiospora selenospora]